MAVRSDLPPTQKTWCAALVGLAEERRAGATRSDACGVERAKVHPKALDFPSPVTCTPETYHPLRAVAHHPTGINLRMTEGLSLRERKIAMARNITCLLLTQNGSRACDFAVMHNKIAKPKLAARSPEGVLTIADLLPVLAALTLGLAVKCALEALLGFQFQRV